MNAIEIIAAATTAAGSIFTAKFMFQMFRKNA
jgi:hypothetical protein